MPLAASLVPGQTKNTDTENGATVEPIQLTDQTFTVGVSKGITFVDFWAEWCPPCKMVAPLIHKLAQTWQGKITFAKVDIDANQLTQAKFQIMSIPTFILFVNGEAKEVMSGAMPEHVFTDFLTKAYETYSK